MLTPVLVINIRPLQSVEWHYHTKDHLIKNEYPLIRGVVMGLSWKNKILVYSYRPST